MLLRLPVRAVAGLSALGATLVSVALAGSAGWRPPETIAPRSDGTLIGSPLVAVDGRGNAIVTWGELSGADWSGASAEHPPGAGWTRSPSRPEVPQALAVNERGDAAIAWVERSAGGDRIAVSFRRRGGRWRPPSLVSPAGQQASSPRVALDAGGGALVVWLDRAPTGDSVVTAAARSVDGAWSRPNALAAGNDAVTATAADGRALVVWSQACDEVAPAAACEPAGAVTRAATRSARGRWGRPRTLSDPGDDARHPRVRVNAAGTAVVLWETFDTNEGAPPSRGLGAAIGRTGGAFARPQRLFEAAADGSARVALAPTGDAVAVWSSSDRIYAAIRRPRGRFGAPALLGAGFEPEVGIDRRGAAIAVWTRPDGTEPFLHELFVRAARRPAGGVFDGGADLAPVGRDCTRHRGCASEVALAVAPNGSAVAAWLAHRGSGLAPGDRSLEAAVYATGSRR